VRIYYAHAITLYGTVQEERDISTLESLGFMVENPNHPFHDEGYRREGKDMDYFLRLIDRCEGLAFRALFDGSITSGCVLEIEHARKLGMPIIELPSNVYRRGLSKEQTLEFLRESGQR
jgi:hypothetical protein